MFSFHHKSDNPSHWSQYTPSRRFFFLLSSSRQPSKSFRSSTCFRQDGLLAGKPACNIYVKTIGIWWGRQTLHCWTYFVLSTPLIFDFFTSQRRYITWKSLRVTLCLGNKIQWLSSLAQNERTKHQSLNLQVLWAQNSFSPLRFYFPKSEGTHDE